VCQRTLDLIKCINKVEKKKMIDEDWEESRGIRRSGRGKEDRAVGIYAAPRGKVLPEREASQLRRGREEVE
jgi:hypothetical protein